MKKLKVFCSVLVLSAVVMLGLSMLAGCESANGLAGVQLSPSSATISPTSNSVTFVATLNVTNTTLALPLTWSLANGSLGRIVGSSGLNAVYVGNGQAGNNVITVKDQYGNEGAASITQVSNGYTLTLAASPASLNPGTNACTVTVTGGTAPYSWSIGDSSLGSISGSDSSAVYISSRAGSNVITARDANGVSGSISITQTSGSSSSSGGTPVPGGMKTNAE